MHRPVLRLLAPLCLIIPAVIAGPARADCRARVDELQPRIAQVADGTQRQLLDNDMRHARKELAEGDESDCNKWMDRAAKLMEGK